MQAKIDKLIEEKLPRSAKKKQEICELFSTLSEEEKEKLFGIIDEKISSMLDEKKIFLPKPVFGTFIQWIISIVLLIVGYIFYLNHYNFKFLGIFINYQTFYYVAPLFFIASFILGPIDARNDNLNNLKEYIQKNFKNSSENIK